MSKHEMQDFYVYETESLVVLASGNLVASDRIAEVDGRTIVLGQSAVPSSDEHDPITGGPVARTDYAGVTMSSNTCVMGSYVECTVPTGGPVHFSTTGNIPEIREEGDLSSLEMDDPVTGGPDGSSQAGWRAMAAGVHRVQFNFDGEYKLAFRPAGLVTGETRLRLCQVEVIVVTET